MGYTGPGLDFGAFQKIDDISSGFNNSNTEFNIQIGGQTAEIVKTDLTDVYDSYVKRLDKVKTTHVKNTEKAKEISKDLIQTIGTLEEDNPTYKTKEGDEEE